MGTENTQNSISPHPRSKNYEITSMKSHQGSPNPWMLMCFFFVNLTLFVIKLVVLVLFYLLYYISIMTRPSCKVIWMSCGCFFCNGRFSWLIIKNYDIFSARVKITFNTLLYIYIVLHGHVKSYIYIVFSTFLLNFVKLYQYIYFYTYICT
jgi:hypothetical protein